MDVSCLPILYATIFFSSRCDHSANPLLVPFPLTEATKPQQQRPAAGRDSQLPSPHNGNSGLISRCAALLRPPLPDCDSVLLAQEPHPRASAEFRFSKYLSAGMNRITIAVTARASDRANQKYDVIIACNPYRAVISPFFTAVLDFQNNFH